MSANTLHITNGDSVLYLWKKSGLPGTHLAWKDVLHEGPVPGGLPLEELSRVRAAYLAGRGYGNAIRINRDFEKRDAAVRRAAEYDAVVLWFEHDLYDQLQLLQAVHTFASMGHAAGRIELVQSEHYLGMLAADELMALYPKRRFVTSAMEQAIERAWQAFTDSSAEPLAAAARAEYAGLPYLRDALRRFCEEYPDTASGLSRTQKQILEACAQGARTPEEIFRRSQAREEASFLGDMPCDAEIAELCEEPAPLLTKLEHGYEPTVLGRRVLAGDADWLQLRAPDRWRGGVHLTASSYWRWDEPSGTLIHGNLAVQG